MKKKKLAIFISLVICLCLCSTAYAVNVVFGENLWVTTSYENNNINGVTGYGTTESPYYHTYMYNETFISDYNGNELDFSYASSKNPNAESVTAFVVTKNLIPNAWYRLESNGYIEWYTAEGEWRSIDEDATDICYSGNSRTVSEEITVPPEYLELRDQYIKDRADYIFEKFGMDPNQYQYACGFDLCVYTGCTAYQFARETMERSTISTIPTFYVNDSADTFFAVYQNEDAENYFYEYSLGEDGDWYIKDFQKEQDIGRYNDTVQSLQSLADFRAYSE